MNICYFAGGITYNKAAGPSAHIVNIAKELNKKEDVDVELLFNGFTMDVPDLNFKLLNLSGVQETVITVSKHEKIDDVAIRGLNPFSYLWYFINAIRFFFKKRGAYDVVIERMWRLGGICGLLLKRFPGPKKPLFILEENGPMKFDRKLDSAGNIMRYVLHGVQRKYAGYIYKNADAIVVQTHFLKEFIANGFGIGEKMIHVIPNGVDTEHFSPLETAVAKKAVGFPAGKKVVMYVGSIDAFHDLSELTAAFHETQKENVILVIIGDGIKKERLVSAIKESGRKNVLYLGPVSHDILPTYINASDICIAPYNIGDFEKNKFVFSPLKILEYMACAKAVVSQPIGYIKELVEDGRGGFLVSNNKDVYLSLLNTIAKGELEVLGAMGRYNRSKAMKFKWSAQAEKYIDLIENLVNDG